MYQKPAAQSFAPAMAPKAMPQQMKPAMALPAKPMTAQPAQMAQAPVADVQSASMAQEQVKAISPQLPQGAVGRGRFASNYSQGKVMPDRRFQAMKNLVSGNYKF